jgi:hypothetical protein
MGSAVLILRTTAGGDAEHVARPRWSHQAASVLPHLAAQIVILRGGYTCLCYLIRLPEQWILYASRAKFAP